MHGSTDRENLTFTGSVVAVPFEQQANGASSVGSSVPSHIPASISIGVAQELIEAMFKTWSAT